MNYLLAAFVGAVTLWAAHNRFGTEGLILLGACLLVGLAILHASSNPRGKLTPGEASFLTRVGATLTIPAALILAGGLVAEFTGQH